LQIGNPQVFVVKKLLDSGNLRKCGNLWYQSILQFSIFGTNYWYWVG
jgi:hypothetical protein